MVPEWVLSGSRVGQYIGPGVGPATYYLRLAMVAAENAKNTKCFIIIVEVSMLLFLC